MTKQLGEVKTIRHLGRVKKAINIGIKRVVLLAAAFILTAATFVAGYAAPVSAECLPFPTQSQVTVKVTIPTSGDYRIWLRQSSPSSGGNPIFLKIDNECPLLVAKNEKPNEFAWVGIHDPNQPLVFDLTAGEHTVILAGNQTGVQVDKGLFAADRDCVPVDSGENCLHAELAVERTVKPSGEIIVNGLTIEPALAKKTVWLWVIGGAIIGLGAAVGFLLWRYHGFIKKVIMPTTGMSPTGLEEVRNVTRHAFKLSTLRKFLAHHRIFVAICGAVIALLIASLTLGIVNADNRPVFEVENGVLSGDAAVVTGTGAVIFGKPPVASVNKQNQNGSNNTLPETTPEPGGDDTPGPGDDDEDDGDVTLPGECPPFPAFPDENCTGWQHTGVTLHECETDQGYIWDSNLEFDSCYFPQPLTIYGSNIRITRSQIHGTVTPHWSKSYDFTGLTLIDVEIEQTDVVDINSAAIAGHNYTCLRCNVHDTLSGMHFGDNTTIRDSYTHDFQWRDEAHGAGIGTGQDHGSNSFIIHNNIQCNRISGPPICSSALSIYPEDDNGDGITIHNVQVEKNQFNATGAYCVYAVSIPGSNINFIDNYFGKKFYPYCAGYGPVAGYDYPGGLWLNNVWADGSGPVDPKRSYP
ncbi:MAG TPA: hypothetical protein VM581_03055 [Magnetospirillaceae bacterium]|nr:hypothetical protein [Magnetospirillaceae bacterium]